MTQVLDDIDRIDPPADDDGGGRDGEPGKWVTVGIYWEPTEAHIARLKLEGEDIPCVMIDENTVGMSWVWAAALGGIKLQVPEEDAFQARELITTSTERRLRQSDEPLYDGQLRCPRCGSEDLFPTRFSRGLLVTSLVLLGLPILFLRRRTRCAACRFEWKP